MNTALARLPDGWRTVRLSEVCAVGSFRDPTQEPEKSFKYVDISGVDNVLKRIAKAQTIAGRNAPSRARKVIRSGDVLVANVRPNLNAVALVPPELDNEVCSTGFTVLRPSERIVSEYLFAFVRSDQFVRPLSELVKGALYPAVTDKQVLDMEVPLPPLQEQKRIAAMLNEQMAAVEKARAAAEERFEAASLFWSACLRSVFSSAASLGWQSRKLGEISEIVGGLQKTPDRAPRLFFRPYLTVRNVQRGHLDLSQIEEFEVTQNELRKLRLLRGDILIVEGNGSIDHIGRNALFTDDGREWIHQNHIIRVRLDRGVCNPDFVSCFLNSEAGRMQMIEKARTSSGLYTLSAGKVSELEIPVPTLGEQEAVVLQLDKRRERGQSLVQAANEGLSAISLLPSTLLRRAFCGQL